MNSNDHPVTDRIIPENSSLLGIGVFNWPSDERVTDRYGFVTLYGEEPSRGDFFRKSTVVLSQTAIRHVDRQRGRLVAMVIVSRDSSHIGDIMRGFYPKRPEVGEIIDLNVEPGELTVILDPVFCVGIIPDDFRGRDWLKPDALYRLHEQTVHLYFVPEVS